MSKREVLAVAGLPLRILEESASRLVRSKDLRRGEWQVEYPDLPKGSSAEVTGELWYYTVQADQTANWSVRAIRLGADGHVLEIESSYYVD